MMTVTRFVVEVRNDHPDLSLTRATAAIRKAVINQALDAGIDVAVTVPEYWPGDGVSAKDPNSHLESAVVPGPAPMRAVDHV